MTVLEPSALKAQMPIGVAGASRIEHFHDIIDTLGARTSQDILRKTGDYTALLTDNRAHILFDSPTDVTFTLPNNLPVGWECFISQFGVGSVNLIVQGGVLGSREGHTRTSGQYASAGLLVCKNQGASPLILLFGDTDLSKDLVWVAKGGAVLTNNTENTVTITGSGSATVSAERPVAAEQGVKYVLTFNSDKPINYTIEEA